MTTSRTSDASARPISTVGYQATTVPAFLQALTDEGVELLVDVRAVASSRRPGFSKSALAANLASVGIDYLHLRGLGTPADGRAAARAGRHEEMRSIFAEHLRTEQAQAELDSLAGIVRGGRRVCLLCFEADPAECHRTLVVDALRQELDLAVTDIRPEMEED